MKTYIVIPAHNEDSSIALTLESLVNQTCLPTRLIIVNDNSTDATQDIIDKFTKKYEWISSITISSSDDHIPGNKVINAFYKGFELLDDDYDIICKFDADIIFPNNYMDTISNIFKTNPNVGIAGGLPYIKKNDTWIFENVASKDHVRGPLKSYRKDCFKDIEGLKPVIGWDTIDVLVAQYFGWKVITEKSLHVKHLKPTESTYTQEAKFLKGERWYNMRYGFLLTLIASLKSAMNKKQFRYFTNSMRGYLKATRNKQPQYVTKDQGKFIRKLRWKNIRKKVF